jgi:AraC-like DNA-binding protein
MARVVGFRGKGGYDDLSQRHLARDLPSFLGHIESTEQRRLGSAIARAAQYKVKALAAHCPCSERQLEREFARQIKSTPLAWLRGHKLLEARRLSMEGVPSKEIAFRLGYSHVSSYYAWRRANGIGASQLG